MRWGKNTGELEADLEFSANLVDRLAHKVRAARSSADCVGRGEHIRLAAEVERLRAVIVGLGGEPPVDVLPLSEVLNAPPRGEAA